MGHFLHRITARNLLSFGPAGMTLELQPLNVLDWAQRQRQVQPAVGNQPVAGGAAGSGPAGARGRRRPQLDLAGAAGNAGVALRRWRKVPGRVPGRVPGESQSERLRHTIEFTAAGRSFSLVDERVENELPAPGAADGSFLLPLPGRQPGD